MRLQPWHRAAIGLWVSGRYRQTEIARILRRHPASVSRAICSPEGRALARRMAAERDQALLKAGIVFDLAKITGELE